MEKPRTDRRLGPDRRYADRRMSDGGSNDRKETAISNFDRYSAFDDQRYKFLDFYSKRVKESGSDEFLEAVVEAVIAIIYYPEHDSSFATDLLSDAGEVIEQGREIGPHELSQISFFLRSAILD